jgi:hypothetical protein
VSPDQPDLLVLRVRRARLARRAFRACRVSLDPQGLKESSARQGRRESKGSLDPLVRLDLRVSLDRLDLRGLRESKELLLSLIHI